MASHLDSIPGAYRKEGGPGYGSVGAGGVVKLDDGDYYVEANEKLQEVDHQVSAAERLREQDESEVAAFQHDRRGKAREKAVVEVKEKRKAPQLSSLLTVKRRAAGAGRAAASELPASFSEGLLGAEGGSSGSRGGAARGVPVGRSVKGLAKSFGAYLPAGVGGAQDGAKRLGDGVPQGEYSELGDDLAGSSLLGGAPRAGGGGGSWQGAAASYLGGLLGGGGSGPREADAPLIDRVRVNEDWELIRPPQGRPYWHNHATQVSQWEPPAFVSSGS